MSVTIILPEISDDQISSDLRWLTQALMENGARTTGGVLGGEFGYGADFDNDTFTMFPFYWGDCECGHEFLSWEWDENHDHASSCYQQEIRRRGFIDFGDQPRLSYRERSDVNQLVTDAVCKEMGLDPRQGSHVHCTCDYQTDWVKWQDENPHATSCGIARPNFLHKPSGSTVSWYKYIGRSMEVDIRGGWREILSDCVTSL